MRRRRFLQITVVGSALAAGGLYLYRFWQSRAAPPLDVEDKAALRAVIDLLAPSDELSPGALELGVHRQVLAEADGNAAARRHLRQGLTWLDEQATALWGSGFITLAPERQADLLRLCEQQPDRSPPGRFFRQVRSLTFGYYYSHPETWQAIGYSGPPQPLGYPHYTEPPGALS